MTTPTLINLPPPPSDPVTPSDMGPGTPNSTTTSLSALSTTAIKDGHKGHAPSHTHHRSSSADSNSSTNTLDAERADRISRLAGLERVSTVRQPQNPQHPHLQPYASTGSPGAPGGYYPTGGSPLPPGHGYPGTTPTQTQGYFDPVSGTPMILKERSTVGSASATGSAGGRTTWASGSDLAVLDGDKMSEGDDRSSTGGFSDEGTASLVGFGETAGSVRGAVPLGMPPQQSPLRSETERDPQGDSVMGGQDRH